MRQFWNQCSIGVLRKIAIRTRLLGSLVLLSLLPLVISGVLSYTQSSQAIERNTRLFATEIVKQVARNVELQMAQTEGTSEALVLSPRVQSALAAYDSGSAAQSSTARSELTHILLDAYGSFSYINQKYFLGTDRHVADAQVFPQLSDAVERAVKMAVRRAPALRGRPLWTTLATQNQQASVVMLRDIYFKSSSRLAGTLFLGIRSSHFARVFDTVDLGPDSDIFIVDGSSGEILVQTRQQFERVGPHSVAPALRDALVKNLASQGGAGTLTYLQRRPDSLHASDVDDQFASFSPVVDTDWYVVSTIPTRNLDVAVASVRHRMLWIGAICVLVSILLAYLISRSISVPLEHLIAVMQQARRGNQPSRLAKQGSDEITVLTEQFNELSAHVASEQERLEQRVGERTRALEEANRQLAALSLTDSLTGIANRRRFDEVLSTELLRAARTRQPLALMMIDVDFFKRYNDHYGHQEGDACLRRVAGLLQERARRASELVARYGGEEFVVLSAECDAERARALAEDIRAAVAELALPHAQSTLANGCVTISVGIAVLIPDEQQSATDFIRRADQAMYRAKRSGRNQVVLQSDHDGRRAGLPEAGDASSL